MWAGWSLFGRRAGLICAALCAVNPFLTAYAQETRMYALMLVLSLLATAAFLHVFAFGRRQYLPVFAVLLAAMLYTHNWGLFLAVGLVCALVPCWYVSEVRSSFWKDALIGFGGAGLLYLPVGSDAAAPDPAHRRALAQPAELRRARADLEVAAGRRARRRSRSCSPAARGWWRSCSGASRTRSARR